MPRSLAIETSGRIGSIAAAIGGRVLSEEEFPHGLQHAAQIIPIIDRLTRAQGWGPRDVQELYLSIGPGSFTGLRIGVTLAKAMSMATEVRIVAVPSVAVLVENAPAEAREVIVVLDAKRGQIFTARFERSIPSPGTPGEGGGEGLRRGAPSVEPGRAEPSPDPLPEYRERGRKWVEREPAHLDDLASMLARAGRPVHLLGEGIPYHRQFIPDDPGVIVTSEESWRARAGAVVRIGHEMARRGAFADPMTLKPIYIRVPEAEEKFEKRVTG